MRDEMLGFPMARLSYTIKHEQKVTEVSNKTANITDEHTEYRIRDEGLVPYDKIRKENEEAGL